MHVHGCVRAMRKSGSKQSTRHRSVAAVPRMKRGHSPKDDAGLQPKPQHCTYMHGPIDLASPGGAADPRGWEAEAQSRDVHYRCEAQNQPVLVTAWHLWY